MKKKGYVFLDSDVKQTGPCSSTHTMDLIGETEFDDENIESACVLFGSMLNNEGNIEYYGEHSGVVYIC